MMYAFNNCSFTKINLQNQPNHDYLIEGKWADSGIEHEVIVKAPDLFKYHQGVHIQDCFPYLSRKDREFLISGMWLEEPTEEEHEYIAVSFKDGDTGPNNPDDGSWKGR